MTLNSSWITGAHGFIGKHLAKSLSLAGNKVSGIGYGSFLEQQKLIWGISDWISGDINFANLQLLQKQTGLPDVIYHLAGGSSVGLSLANPREDFIRTVCATAELLEWVRTNSPNTCLVIASSAAVYGGGYRSSISESDLVNPYSPYGYHKKIIEDLCRSYGSNFGVRVSIARLFSVYGSHLQKQLLWDLCTKLSSGLSKISLSGVGSELRDWTDVRDVVRALKLLSSMALDTVPVFNVGTGVPTSVHDVTQRLIEVWPTKSEIIFSGQSRAGDPFSLYSNSNLMNSIGFECEIPIELGIPNYVEWYLSRDWNAA
jgi:UDP-glucose 4-epimerase